MSLESGNNKIPENKNAVDTARMREEIQALEKRFAHTHGEEAANIEADILERENEIREAERERERATILNRLRGLEHTEAHPGERAYVVRGEAEREYGALEDKLRKLESEQKPPERTDGMPTEGRENAVATPGPEETPPPISATSESTPENEDSKDSPPENREVPPEEPETPQSPPTTPISPEENKKMGEEDTLERVAASLPEDPPLTIPPEGFETQEITRRAESSTEFVSEQAALTEAENRNVYERLGASGKKMWESLSDDARHLFKRAQETVADTPNAILGKFQLAYRQFWADRHETKAARLKEKMDGLNLAIQDLGNSAHALESNVAQIRAQNLPGAERLELAVKTLELRQRELLNKRDKLQSKFEAQENRRNLFINKRDALADRFIHTYNERMEPLGGVLENLSRQRDRLELLGAVKETQWREQSERLDAIARVAQNNPSLKEVWKIVAEGRAKINREKMFFNKRRAEIEGRIAKVDKRANPYRDKRDQFERIKQGRPIKMNVEPRTRVPYAEVKPEPVSPHPRRETPSSFETPPSPIEGDLSLEAPRGQAVSEYITGWFARMHENAAPGNPESFGAAEAQEFTREFLRSTGYTESSRLLPQEIRNVMEKYLKILYRDRPGAEDEAQRRATLLKGLDEFLGTLENK